MAEEVVTAVVKTKRKTKIVINSNATVEKHFEREKDYVRELAATKRLYDALGHSSPYFVKLLGYDDKKRVIFMEKTLANDNLV